MRIGILGAGLSGLRAATLLEAQGAEVTVLEAKDRIGGRVWTRRFDDFAYDAGGEWIDSDHHRCLNLANELGAEVEASNDVRQYWYGSEVATSEGDWEDVRITNEKFDTAARACLLAAPSPQANLGELIAKSSTSKRAEWWLTANCRSDEGEEPSRVGLSGWLSTFAIYANRTGGELSAFRLKDGFDLLVTGLRSRLRGDVLFGEVARSIAQDAGGATVTTERGQTHRFDRLVVTLPPTVLRRLDLSQAVPPEQSAAFAACGMGRIVKVCLAFCEPWWEEVGWSGQGLFSEGHLQQSWVGSRGGAPVLTHYVCGDSAAHWSLHADPICAAVEELCTRHPQAGRHFVQGWLHDWIADPCAGGGFSFLPSGFDAGQRALLRKWHGRIHFAGEHTADWQGFFEGCLESAERVLEEVLHDAE